jgi:hypothetical protein
MKAVLPSKGFSSPDALSMSLLLRHFLHIKLKNKETNKIGRERKNLMKN